MSNWWEQLLRRRESFRPVVECGARGFVVRYASQMVSVHWCDVIEIEAWKRDCVGIDLITLDLMRQDGTTVFVDEEMEGYDRFLTSAATHLPAFNRDAWWPEVAFPPFAENRTMIWKRADSVASM